MASPKYIQTENRPEAFSYTRLAATEKRCGPF